jgi:hypothetical protein
LIWSPFSFLLDRSFFLFLFLDSSDANTTKSESALAFAFAFGGGGGCGEVARTEVASYCVMSASCNDVNQTKKVAGRVATKFLVKLRMGYANRGRFFFTHSSLENRNMKLNQIMKGHHVTEYR